MADDFDSLVERVLQGDEEAATELFHKYREPILFIVRQRLNRYRQLRSEYDSTDFLQEAVRALLNNPEKLRDFHTFTAFIKYLGGVARNQVEKARQTHLDTQKRDLNRTCYLGDPNVAAAAEAVPDPRPDPAQRVSSGEEWLRWLQSLPPPQRPVFLLLRAGHTHEEVAARLGISVRTIERMIAVIRAASPPKMLASNG